MREQYAAGMTEDGFRCGNNTPQEVRRNSRHVLLETSSVSWQYQSNEGAACRQDGDFVIDLGFPAGAS